LLGIFLQSFYFVGKSCQAFCTNVAATVLYPDKSIGYFFCYLILNVYGCDGQNDIPPLQKPKRSAETI